MPFPRYFPNGTQAGRLQCAFPFCCLNTTIHHHTATTTRTSPSSVPCMHRVARVRAPRPGAPLRIARSSPRLLHTKKGGPSRTTVGEGEDSPVWLPWGPIRISSSPSPKAMQDGKPISRPCCPRLWLGTTTGGKERDGNKRDGQTEHVPAWARSWPRLKSQRGPC